MENKFDSYVEELKSSKEWLDLDSLRKKTLKLYVFSWFLGVVLFILAFVILIFSFDLISFLGCLVVSVAIPLMLVRKHLKEFSAKYKGIVVPKLISDVITDFDSNADRDSNSNSSKQRKNKCQYYPTEKINFNLLASFPLFERYPHKKTIYDGEDLFKGTIGETHFQFSDLIIKRNRDLIVVDQDFDFTIFRGLVFIADFHKDFDGTTTIRTRKGKQYRLLKALGSRITTISHHFDQMFTVHTTDEITARYLLPANMLERIMALRSIFPDKGIAICLHKGKLIISIHKHDFFEIGKASMPRSRNIVQTYTEISEIIEMIDVLNLNLRIWNKK